MRDAGEAAAATRELGDLCRAYWYPLYAFARRKGFHREDAEDATQGFFAYLVARNLFGEAEPQLGRLRTFLLTAFERFLGGLRDREHAQNRGGGRESIQLDVTDGESRYAHEPATMATPERLFERSWAMTVLTSALAVLRAEEAAAGRGAEFRELEPFLSPTGESEASYAATAASLGAGEAAVRQAVSRLRRKFRAFLRRQIADTLADPTEAQLDEELASLRAALHA